MTPNNSVERDRPQAALVGGPSRQTLGLAMNRFRRRAIVLGVLVSASLSAFAETFPPIAPFDAITWKATMKRKPSTGLKMGTFRVRFESTTLDDVRRAASVGAIAHRGDAGESAYWLCYTSAGRTQKIGRAHV